MKQGSRNKDPGDAAPAVNFPLQSACRIITCITSSEIRDKEVLARLTGEAKKSPIPWIDFWHT